MARYFDQIVPMSVRARRRQMTRSRSNSLLSLGVRTMQAKFTLKTLKVL